MLNSNINKEKWRQITRDSLKWSISKLLAQTETTGIRLEILESIPEGDIKMDTFKSSTHKSEQEYDLFYLGPTTEDVSEFGIYQKRMSLRNHNKFICLKDNQPIAELSYEETGCYNDAIVNFIMANIVWE